MSGTVLGTEDIMAKKKKTAYILVSKAEISQKINIPNINLV